MYLLTGGGAATKAPAGGGGDGVTCLGVFPFVCGLYCSSFVCPGSQATGDWFKCTCNTAGSGP